MTIKHGSIVKHCIYISLFILGMILINLLLSYLLIPNVAYSRKVQHDILWSEQSYDVIAFGSSEMFYAFDAPYASAALGRKCYNMGTSGTTLDGGVYATFDDVMRYQSPQTVILIMGTSLMTEAETEDAIAYAGIEPYMRSVPGKAGYFIRSFFYGDVLGRLFPWSVHHSQTLSEVIENVRVKCSRSYRAFDKDVLPNISLVYIGEGFCAQLPGEENDNVVNYDGFDPDSFIDPKTGTFISNKAIFRDEHINALESIIRKARKKGAQVIVAMAPMTRSKMLRYRCYDSYSGQLRDICMRENADFVDLNYARPELYDPQPYEYVDDSHVLIDGARRYTEALCKYMKFKEDGADTDDLFCHSWEEFCDMVDWTSYGGFE